MPSDENKLKMAPHEKGVDTVKNILGKYRKRKDDL
jgi:hypothetical protein